MSENQPVKILLSYDIPDEVQETYYRFVTGEFVPQVNRLGLELAEVWETVYGEYPRRLIVFVAQDHDTCNQAMNSDKYQRLERKLLRYVRNYTKRIVPYKGQFQF
ncbi:MAG TPA: hypothetical protein VFD70_30095 [Anaerolineae bacterium]|nr:hypothetical protein [Anaerolineae bacterium]